MPLFGRTTVVKFLGGELLVKEVGTDLVAMRSRLEGVKRRALNLGPVFSEFKPIWLQATRQVFAAQGLPVPWPALSPAYAAWKRQHYPGKTMMRRTDRLYRSLTQDRSGDMIWEATPRTIRYGTRVPYHQFGQLRRPTVILLRSSFDRLNKMVLAYVSGGGGRA